MMTPLMLTLLVAAPPSISVAPSGQTLWLTQPLYPQQEGFVPRVEDAVAQLFSPADRARQVIGRAELAARLKGNAIALDCVFGTSPCDDLRLVLSTKLGFDRIVLVKAGQDESLYRFKVLNFEREAASVTVGEASDAQFGKALRGALVKSVPLSATLIVRTMPAGAKVFVDDELVGTTPLPPTQVLAGERAIRIELAFHNSVQLKQGITVGGTVMLEPTLNVLGLPRKTWGFVSLGAGALAGSAGAFLGASALSKARYTQQLPQVNEVDYQRTVASTRSTAHLADGLYLVALAGAGLGTWLVLGESTGEPAGRIVVGGKPLAVGIAPLRQGGAITLGGGF